MALFCFLSVGNLSAKEIRSVSSPWYLSTDKCNYHPGEQVTVHFSGDMPSGARIRIYSGSEVLTDDAMGSASYKWTAPSRDFAGYLAVVYTSDASGNETLYGTIAIDVSSWWGRFPRYGFVATYDDSKTESAIQGETAFLNRCHINGIQYYDWQYLHEIPYDKYGHRDSWTDLANRQIRADVVRNYIKEHHRYGMKAARPDKLLVMNGVSNYGGSEIISTGNVEFSYTELWGSEESFWDMERMVREHAAVDGRGTASVFAAFSSPEAFIFFGGMTKAGDLIMRPIKEAYNQHVLPIFRGKAQFLISGLDGASAAVLGASAVGWDAVASTEKKS